MIGSFLAWMLTGAVILMALTALWQVILPLAGIAFAIYAVIWGAATIVLKVTTRINDGYDKHQQIAARADAQHRKLMAGDDVAGVYGEYLPSKEFLPQSPPKSYQLHALDWFNIAGVGRVAVVSTPEGIWEPNDLAGLVVDIDGSSFVVQSVETHCISRSPKRPYRGPCGLLVIPSERTSESEFNSHGAPPQSPPKNCKRGVEKSGMPKAKTPGVVT